MKSASTKLLNFITNINVGSFYLGTFILFQTLSIRNLIGLNRLSTIEGNTEENE